MATASASALPCSSTAGVPGAGLCALPKRGGDAVLVQDGGDINETWRSAWKARGGGLTFLGEKWGN